MLEIGGFLCGYEKHTYTISGEKVLNDLEYSLYLKRSNRPAYAPFAKAEFLQGISGLHIGEWKKEYEDLEVLDGTQWSIEIEYEDDRKPVYIRGSNAYPNNFHELTEFLGIDFEEYR